jgi:hypothetical protein
MAAKRLLEKWWFPTIFGGYIYGMSKASPECHREFLGAPYESGSWGERTSDLNATVPEMHIRSKPVQVATESRSELKVTDPQMHIRSKPMQVTTENRSESNVTIPQMHIRSKPMQVTKIEEISHDTRKITLARPAVGRGAHPFDVPAGGGSGGSPEECDKRITQALSGKTARFISATHSPAVEIGTAAGPYHRILCEDDFKVVLEDQDAFHLILKHRCGGVVARWIGPRWIGLHSIQRGDWLKFSMWIPSRYNAWQDFRPSSIEPGIDLP